MATTTEKLSIPDTGITIVDFYADWCNPCKVLSPVLDEISKTGINIIKINVDNSPEISSERNISSIPCLEIYKDGKFVEKSIGVLSLDALNAKIDKFR